MLRFPIEGKVALITGASEGIGAACARAFARRGARLSLVARSEEKLRAAGGSAALITAGDIASPEVRREAVSRTLEHFGSLDILINNAGVGLYAPAWRANMEDTRRMFEVNFFAPLLLAQLAAPHMIARRCGAIVNVGSIAGKVALPWFTLYSASKFAIQGLGDGLRMELQSKGVHVMTVCPGYVQTDFQAHVLSGRPPEGVAKYRRFTITADQCAEAIARGLERRARTVLAPPAGWLFVALSAIAPRAVDAVMGAIYRREVEP